MSSNLELHRAGTDSLARRRIGSARALACDTDTIEFDVETSLRELKSRFRHDNPHWAVSSPAAAEMALEIHRECDPLECSTRVAAVIVSRHDFLYFRERAARAEVRECR